MTRDGQNEAGTTLVETILVIAVLAIVLSAIMGTEATTNHALRANNRAAAADEIARRILQRVAPIARSGLLSTFKVKATAQDVADAEAAQLLDPSVVVPTEGEWISPTDDDPRDNICFESADGVFTMSGIPMSNVSNTTGPQALEFRIEDGEAPNGTDDDDDGMVDEGTLVLTNSTGSYVIGRGVEHVQFSLHERVMKLVLTTASSGGKDEVARGTHRHKVYLRNN